MAGRISTESSAANAGREGATFEVHAGRPYWKAIEAPLAQTGTTTPTLPLLGLPLGKQLRWYAAMRDLDGAPALIAARAWPGDRPDLNQAGLG